MLRTSMINHIVPIAAALSGSAVLAIPAAAQDVSMGERLSVIAGCHDCHTAEYNESGGQIDPDMALKGAQLGFQGPWGTTYAANLRLTAAERSAEEWVEYMQSIETRPPMPWFNLHKFTQDESAALHAYIVSLGDPGDPVPAFVPPGETPETPFIVMAPPNMPGQ